MPQLVDVLVEKSNLPPQTVSAILTVLELNEAARNIGAGMWVRV